MDGRIVVLVVEPHGPQPVTARLTEAGLAVQAARTVNDLSDAPTAVGVVATAGIADAVASLARWHSLRPRQRLLALPSVLDLDLVPAAVRAGADGICVATAPTEALLRVVETVAAGQACLPRAADTPLLKLVRSPRPLPPAGRLALLSPRELHVLLEFASGLSTAQVAADAGIAEVTVRSHLSRAMRKLRVTSREEAMQLLATQPG